MTALDKTGKKVAASLLGKFGKPMTLKTQGETVYNPATGEVVKTSNMVLFQGIIRAPEGSDVANGYAVISDRIVTMKADGLSAYPIPNDRVLIDSDEYTVKQVRETWSGEKIVLFDLVVGK